LLVLIAFVILNVASKKLNMSNADVKVENLKPNGTINKNTSSKIMSTFNLDLESDVVLISNLNTGRVLYQQNADQKVSTASIAKLLSAIIVLENMDVDEIININDTIYNSLPSKTDLILNENIKVIDLLKMTLIMSSNDAVSALAHHLGYYDFLAKMNLKANEIGMYNSHFDNPIGFDGEGNYSTAFDLFQLAKYVYTKFPLIGEITKSHAITVKSESNIEHLVVPTNLAVDKLENF
jgi:serine-type D-Ala-D-Ala carboxypeptidase (penicillin-binding protein 5/6)